MNNRELFTYTSKYGSYKDCYFKVSRYVNNNNLAIFIMNDTEGTIALVTVSTDVTLPDTMIAVKHYSENEGMVEFLLELGVITPEQEVAEIRSGYVVIPVHKLTDKGKRMILGDED